MRAKTVVQLPAHILGEVFFWSVARFHVRHVVKITALNPAPGIVALVEPLNPPTGLPDEIEVDEDHDLTRAYWDSEVGWSV